MPFIHVDVNDKGNNLSVTLEAGPAGANISTREQFMVEQLVALIQEGSVAIAKGFLGATSHIEAEGKTKEEADRNLQRQKNKHDDKFFPLQ